MLKEVLLLNFQNTTDTIMRLIQKAYPLIPLKKNLSTGLNLGRRQSRIGELHPHAVHAGARLGGGQQEPGPWAVAAARNGAGGALPMIERRQEGRTRGLSHAANGNCHTELPLFQ